MHEPKLIRCMVVDDEPPAREIIRRYIEEIPMLGFCGECSNAVQAIGFLQREPVDLLFLDIRMPQLTGIDFLKTLPHRPKTIFTTAYAQYALEGYELDVVDYLLKPVRFDRFVKAVNKAFPPGQKRMEEAELPTPELTKAEDSFVYFRVDRKMVKVMLKDILYIESMKDYVKIFLPDSVLITKQPISSVGAMLPERQFIRIHRSFIVSLSKISSFSSELIGIGNTEIPIGKLFRQAVMKQIAS